VNLEGVRDTGEDAMQEGGCFCGFVRYRVEGPTNHETLCHCSICRRTSGAPLVAWFTVVAAKHRFLCGEPVSFHSSDHGTRSFCPRCGTPLLFASDRSPGEVDVTTCTLDRPEGVAPRDHTHAASRLSWLTSEDGRPVFPGARGDGHSE
jgi:hypothetical protein